MCRATHAGSAREHEGPFNHQDHPRWRSRRRPAGFATDWRLGADYYFFRNAGLGVQYKYNKYREAYAALSANLGGDLVFKGFQVFASFLF
jgi:hypothetical protein